MLAEQRRGVVVDVDRVVDGAVVLQLGARREPQLALVALVDVEHATSVALLA